MEYNMKGSMVNPIPVEIRKITDPDGRSRLGAVAFLGGVLSTPDIKDRLSSLEEKYTLLLKQCENILEKTKTTAGRSDATLRWQLAQKVGSFLDLNMKNEGVVFVNYVEALQRDLEVSESELRYIFKFFKKYKNEKELDTRINWSKYRELMDFSDEKLRKQCETLIKEGKIKSDKEIRAFKRQMKTVPN
jgi:hypothetical protein